MMTCQFKNKSKSIWHFEVIPQQSYCRIIINTLSMWSHSIQQADAFLQASDFSRERRGSRNARGNQFLGRGEWWGEVCQQLQQLMRSTISHTSSIDVKFRTINATWRMHFQRFRRRQHQLLDKSTLRQIMTAEVQQLSPASLCQQSFSFVWKGQNDNFHLFANKYLLNPHSRHLGS